jgi:carbon storage regulator CsrA
VLVLSRKKGEVLWVGDKIRVVVLEIGYDRIRLGVDAPPGVAVLREEIVRPGGAFGVQEALGAPPPPPDEVMEGDPQ